MQKTIQNIISLPGLLLLVTLHAGAQVTFKTIVPQAPVMAGESFSVQYVIEDEKSDGFIPPVFNGFRLVSGPNIYYGSPNSINGPRMKNIVFTLVAIRPGKFIIPGATVKMNGQFIKSNNAEIIVISKAASFEKGSRENQVASEYFLRPGEDPYEKMRRSLFMKVMVDKRTCYVGQPVVATFKLYSQLESKSDIVKNPGFYGFTVQDIINLNDNISSTETINGKPFDVHTVRVVQLYPLQPGLFTIDPMEVMNKVEFSKSVVNKKTEQEITEGVYEHNDHAGNGVNTVTYENSISTEKINIQVKPYPDKNKHTTFNGATGNFSIQAASEKNDLAKNEQGDFIITLRGKGNFTQLSAPVIQWPAGIESFEPIVKDSLDKTQTPLKGTRTFRYSFISGDAGSYVIPAISFSFFDPDSNRYKIISTQPTEIKISNKEKKEVPPKQQSLITPKNNYKAIWLFGVIALLIVIVISVLLRKPGKERTMKETSVEKHEKAVSIEQLLQPARFSLIADDGSFYILLQKAIWDYLSDQLNLSGSQMNKDQLYKTMKEKKWEEDQCRGILAILQQCEAAVFTKAEFANDKQELFARTKTTLEQVKV
jgi:BatD DUF11 like domain